MATILQPAWQARGRSGGTADTTGLDTVVRIVVFVGCLMTIMLPLGLLVQLGWDYTGDSSGLQKFHPVTYVLLVSSFLALLTLRHRYWDIPLSWRFGPFAAMVMVLVAWAALGASRSSGANGLIGVAVTSFLTPLLLLISFPALRSSDCRLLARLIHGFVILNSLSGLFESVTHIEIVYAQEGSVWRSGGIAGHPLSSALITGMMIVYLLSAGGQRKLTPAFIGEVALHALALFTFGSRSGLLLVPIVIVIGTLLPERGARRGAGSTRRIVSIALLLAGLALTQLPIDFIQNALDRFTSDSGSADTRTAALQIVTQLDFRSLLRGIDVGQVLALQSRFGTEVAIEAAWILLILRFGIVVVVPLAITFALLVVRITRLLDRSAVMVAIYFLILTAGSVSFGNKSLAICQMLVFILTMCQPTSAANRPAAPQPPPPASAAPRRSSV